MVREQHCILLGNICHVTILSLKDLKILPPIVTTSAFKTKTSPERKSRQLRLEYTYSQNDTLKVTGTQRCWATKLVEVKNKTP